MNWLKSLWQQLFGVRVATSPTVLTSVKTPTPPQTTGSNSPSSSSMKSPSSNVSAAPPATPKPSAPVSVPKPQGFPQSCHFESKSFALLREEYEYLWANCMIEGAYQKDAHAACLLIEKNKPRYQRVEAETSVPWYFVAAVHMRECDFNFNKHLHNGDPLTERTVHVPKGRPVTGEPPFTWEESAIDSLHFQGLAGHKDWTLGTTFFRLEEYNGMGYRDENNLCLPRNASPYIYAGTNFYKSGKYGSDGHFVSTLIDEQLGCMALLHALAISGEQIF